MSDSEEKDELLKAINKIQWALGESMFRAKKLKTLTTNNNKIKHGLDRDFNELILAISQITNLYRHNIAERFKSVIQ